MASSPPHPSGVHRIAELTSLEPAHPSLEPRGEPATPPAPTATEPSRTPPHPGVEPRPSTVLGDLSAPELFLNRELTYLNFCLRVLHEADDPRTPTLERVKFLAIVGSNVDEFFMKRIGGLKQQVGANLHSITPDGRTPQQQIHDALKVIAEVERRRSRILPELLAELRRHGVWVASWKELEPSQQTQLRDYYLQNIFPLVTPQSMDPAHPFPFVSNLSVNLLVTLHYPDDDEMLLARVKVPVGSGIPRFLRVTSAPGHTFVPLEEVIAANLDLLFPGMTIASHSLFRVTRNASTEQDEQDADDLLELIEIELRERRFAPVVRLQVQSTMSAFHRGKLAAELGLDENADVFATTVMLGQRDLIELATLDAPELSHLRDPPHAPSLPVELPADRPIFHTIRDTRSILVQHPYESFQQSVERFLKEAASDPKVRAIKMTLYRTAKDSDVIKHLLTAAKNGKQVAVVLELKAKFDEEANIRWASRMERAGIHVTYGVVGLKTHCKVILVVRQDYDGLRRYAHLGTGNYHAGTARLYGDLGVLTCDDGIGRDLTELFNYLTTGFKPRRKYVKLLPAPKIMKGALIDKIEREIAHQDGGARGVIQWKLNALEDVDIVKALYRAAQKGVQIDLVVRDTCRLRPQLPGISETVRVVSVVGRFLEHARIFYFENGGKPEYYIGSADMMQRNLERRVEVLVPVDDARLQAELRAVLDIQLADQRSAWEMQSDGSYVQRNGGPGSRGAQQQLIERTEKRLREVSRLKRRKVKGIAKRKLR
jgi:polyphosphate kinase